MRAMEFRLENRLWGEKTGAGTNGSMMFNGKRPNRIQQKKHTPGFTKHIAV